MICGPRCDPSWSKFHVHLRKKVKSPVFGWNILQILIRSKWSNVSFKTYVSLLILYLDNLSIGVSGILKSPTITVLLLLLITPLIRICLMYYGAPILGAYVFIIAISFFGFIFLSLCSILLCVFFFVVVFIVKSI